MSSIAEERPEQQDHRGGVMGLVTRRWPTFLALLLGGDTLFGEVTDATTRRFAEVLLLLPLLYLIVAVLRRRRASWPVLLVLVAAFVGLRLQSTVEPMFVLCAIALAAALWGAGHGQLRDADFRWQVVGTGAFGAVAAAGLLVAPEPARYLVAAGWLAHGGWDFVHLARNRVVVRSYAEWCGVLDVLVGVGLIVVPLL